MSLRRTFPFAMCAWAVASYLLLLAVATGQGQQSADRETLLLRARESFQQGRYEQARKRFQRVLDLDPDNRAAFKGLVQTDREIERTQSQTQATNESTETDTVQKISLKLYRIILPQVSFDHIRLADAVEYLRREGIRLDANPDPAQRGMNITVRYPSSTAAPPESSSVPGSQEPGPDPSPSPALATPNSAITFTVYKIPLLESLRYVAAQAGMIVKVLPDGVYLTTSNDIPPSDWQTREFKVPPGFVPAKLKPPTDTNAEVADIKTGTPSEDAKEFLKCSGVQFPPGSNVQYLPATQKLTVRNTLESFDLIEALVADAQQAVVSSAPNP